MDWRTEWFEFEGVAYLNAAGQSPLPRISVRAVQAALEWKKYPHQLSDSIYFELPNRIRASVARLIGGQPEEIALTTGASGGLAAVAAGLDWKPEDEVLMARGEFPAHLSTWMPLEAASRLRVKVITPADRFLTAEDFLAAIGPRTRLVSTSLVRFDDGVLLDAARVAEACHAVGAYLLLDVSQCAGAMPLDVHSLGADFLVAAGYKWLLSPYGTGFFWAKSEHLNMALPGPYYWTAQGTDSFFDLNFVDPKPSTGAKRWDAAEAATYFNFNLAAMNASVDLVLRVGPELVLEHNRRLIELLFERLPEDCVPASPLESAQRGPYGCFTARTAEKTAELYQKLQREKIIVSLREGRIRVSPHLFNSERDIDRLISVVRA